MSGDWRADLEFTHSFELEYAPSALLLRRALERGTRRMRLDDWATSQRTVPDGLGEPVVHVTAKGREHALYDDGATLFQVTSFGPHVAIAIADDDEERVQKTVARLQEAFPSPEPTVRHEVPVMFWTYGQQGPMPSWRSIAVPAWEDVRSNYPTAVGERLEHLMSGFTPARGGQLILWHGVAGTGKTYALRALAWEWREWCEFHYIVDPDAFFGQHADYLMNVLLQPSMMPFSPEAVIAQMGAAGGQVGLQHVFSGMHGEFDEVAIERDDEDLEERGKPWKLLMLEDTGELLTADARAVIGQGLSRFLNVVDGLIGQGLRVLVLVTTNEPIRKLHPAVARPGRSAANIEFQPLEVEAANEWLAAHGADARVERPTTLAALYALAEGLHPGDAATAPGFAG